MKILITSGGTKIPIDSARHIMNMSSGSFGSAIATTFLKNNWEVCFFKAKDSCSPFLVKLDLNKYDSKYLLYKFKESESLKEQFHNNYKEVEFSTFVDYQNGIWELLENEKPDVVMLVAAVSDYGVIPVEGKVRSSNQLKIDLFPLCKIIKQIKPKFPKIKLVGFKLLVNSTDSELKEEINKSINNNYCDLVVGNDLFDIRSGRHKIIIGKPHNNFVTLESQDENKTILTDGIFSNVEGLFK